MEKDGTEIHRDTYRPGFRKESAKKIIIAKQQADRMNRKQVMPSHMVLGIEDIINAALNGHTNQIEIAIGRDPKNVRKVRLVALPAEAGVVEGDARVFTVPNEIGPMRPIKQDETKN